MRRETRKPRWDYVLRHGTTCSGTEIRATAPNHVLRHGTCAAARDVCCGTGHVLRHKGNASRDKRPGRWQAIEASGAIAQLGRAERTKHEASYKTRRGMQAKTRDAKPRRGTQAEMKREASGAIEAYGARASGWSARSDWSIVMAEVFLRQVAGFLRTTKCTTKMRLSWLRFSSGRIRLPVSSGPRRAPVEVFLRQSAGFLSTTNNQHEHEESRYIPELS